LEGGESLTSAGKKKKRSNGCLVRRRKGNGKLIRARVKTIIKMGTEDTRRAGGESLMAAGGPETTGRKLTETTEGGTLKAEEDRRQKTADKTARGRCVHPSRVCEPPNLPNNVGGKGLRFFEVRRQQSVQREGRIKEKWVFTAPKKQAKDAK